MLFGLVQEFFLFSAQQLLSSLNSSGHTHCPSAPPVSIGHSEHTPHSPGACLRTAPDANWGSAGSHLGPATEPSTHSMPTFLCSTQSFEAHPQSTHALAQALPHHWVQRFLAPLQPHCCTPELSVVHTPRQEAHTPCTKHRLVLQLCVMRQTSGRAPGGCSQALAQQAAEGQGKEVCRGA